MVSALWVNGISATGGCNVSKLLQKTQIILPEPADVVDGVLQHDDPLHAHAEGEAGEMSGVITTVLQHHRMHHAGAHDFQPAGPFAQAATFPAANDAVHVHFDGWFGEGKITGTDAHLPLFAEHAVSEGDDGSFQIGHGHALADGQALYLMEHDLAARGDRFIAVT